MEALLKFQELSYPYEVEEALQIPSFDEGLL